MPAPPATVPSNEQNQSVPPTEELDVSVIKSPMVGTFYRSASPDSLPFTDVGAKVGSESVVCIIEAMKVMNEIQSEISGTITEILVENGEAVEYGQPLLKLKLLNPTG